MGCLLPASSLGQPSAFEGAWRVQTRNVKIYAASISIHAGVQNQDTYLGEILVKGGERKLVKFIDVYPAADRRIDRNILRAVPLLSMKVVRTAFCDVTAGQLFFSDKSTVFDDEIRDEIAARPSMILPCFQIVHRSIKLKTERSVSRTVRRRPLQL
jgi:hypothetical protein